MTVGVSSLWFLLRAAGWRYSEGVIGGNASGRSFSVFKWIEDSPLMGREFVKTSQEGSRLEGVPFDGWFDSDLGSLGHGKGGALSLCLFLQFRILRLADLIAGQV